MTTDLMSAVQFRRYGGAEVLEVVQVPRPTPGRNELLVRVEASAVNPHDVAVRSGALKIMTGRKFPLGLGLDFGGTVVEAGQDVEAVRVGARVWGMVSPKSKHVTGAAAQFVVVPEGRVSHSPEGLSMTEAASLVTTGTTAVRALVDVAGLESGQRVLIRGAAGGVGIPAVQLARTKGAHVTGLASRRDADFVTGLGADEVYDYRTVKPAELGPFEVILDTVGTDLLAWRRRLTRGGRMVTVAFGSGSALLSIAVSGIFGGGRIRSFRGDPDGRLLDDLAGHVSSGAIRPVLDTVYPLQQIRNAHTAMDEPGHRGKLVLNTT